MKLSCCVPNCLSKYKGKTFTDESKHSFFAISEERKKLWAERIPNLLSSKYRNPRICERHFKDNFFKNKLKNRLTSNAIPSLYLNIDEKPCSSSRNKGLALPQADGFSTGKASSANIENPTTRCFDSQTSRKLSESSPRKKKLLSKKGISKRTLEGSEKRKAFDLKDFISFGGANFNEDTLNFIKTQLYLFHKNPKGYRYTNE